MVWKVDDWKEVLTTNYVRGVPKDVLFKRARLIDEAIGWGGTIERPEKHEIGKCSDGSLLLFEKPGKEAIEGKNRNDMRPTIIIHGKPLNPPSFAFIWSDLTNIAIKDFEAFRAVLVIIYRNAFLLDHSINSDGQIRYSPNAKLMECINELNRTVGSETEFGSVDGLLAYIDILGWNEDVKYHSYEGRASFTEGKNANKPKIGRINTNLTCIRVPYEVSDFMRRYRKECIGESRASFVQLYDVMQSLINSRGLSIPRTKADLISYLQPYIVDGGAIIGSTRIPTIQRTILSSY